MFDFFVPTANLTFVITSLETNILKHLNELQTTLTNLEHDVTRQKSLDSARASENVKYRKVEIQTFNSTTHVEKNGITMFTYYWKLQGVKNILKNERTRSIRSQSFYVYSNGYRMYLKFLPKFNSELFNVQTGITKGDFDNQLVWPFSLKYRISVLDQDPVDRVEDIVSKIWSPEYICKKTFWMKPINDNHGCIALSFTEEVLLSKNYVKNDSTVIKLTVYLN